MGIWDFLQIPLPSDVRLIISIDITMLEHILHEHRPLYSIL